MAERGASSTPGGGDGGVAGRWAWYGLLAGCCRQHSAGNAGVGLVVAHDAVSPRGGMAGARAARVPWDGYAGGEGDHGTKALVRQRRSRGAKGDHGEPQR